jgi:predicted GNAT family acetyltransferase
MRGVLIMPSITSSEKGFFMEEGGRQLAEITYTLVDENTLSIDHTYVSEVLRGQGIAKQLVEKVIDKARAENKKIIPICGYAQALFKNNEEYEEVLKPGSL